MTTPETTRQRSEHLSRIREFCHELREASSENPQSPDYRFMGKAAASIEHHAEAMDAENGFLRGEIVALRRELGETRLHAEAMEARIDLQDIALRAAAAYIELLEQGKGPSDSHYLPLRDCYRNALDDLLPDPETHAGGDAR